jgi:hypothetical protein
MIRVIKRFYDLQDGGFCYKEGDTFPRKGLKVSDARLAELSGNRNKRGTPLIEIKEAPKKLKKAEAE